MRVQLERDGISLLDESITPEYRTSQPNGEDCPPTCHLADVALSVQ
jgi:hypothetical protein